MSDAQHDANVARARLRKADADFAAWALTRPDDPEVDEHRAKLSRIRDNQEWLEKMTEITSGVPIGPAPGRRNAEALEALWVKPETQTLIASVIEKRQRDHVRLQLRCGDHESGVTIFIDQSAPSIWARSGFRLEPEAAHYRGLRRPTDGTLRDALAGYDVEVHKIDCKQCHKQWDVKPQDLLAAALVALVKTPATSGLRVRLRDVPQRGR